MYKTVQVTWTDAAMLGEWKGVADLPDDATPCITIGFLVKTTKQYFYVASTVSNDMEEQEALANGVMLIPRNWVTDFTELDLDKLKAD